MTIQLNPKLDVSVSATETVTIDYTDHLDEGETLVNPPTIPAVAGLNIANAQTNQYAYRNRFNNLIAPNKAVQFQINPQSTGDYTVQVQVTTSPPTGMNARILIYDVLIEAK